ncbi:MAG: ArsB/NhaD family transporter [Candidatus Eisenbacteria bacterium]|nr:ArsB/NhaD family transporter [Candidatus Eisenbacteria bacterium]
MGPAGDAARQLAARMAVPPTAGMWFPIVVFGVVYALIASEKVDKTVAACLGAALVIMLGGISYHDALTYIDLNVVFLLVGMMMIVGVLAETGFFEWMAVLVARKTRGDGAAVLVLFLVLTAVISAFLDNVTTVVLIAPVTILVCQVLELPVIPFLVLEAVFSNIGGTATLIGDPPNIMIASETGLSFNEFIAHLGPAVVVIMAASVIAVLAKYRRQLVVRESLRKRIEKADPAAAITDHRRLRRGLAVFGLVLLGFFLGRSAGIEPGIVALAGGMLTALACGSDIRRVMGKVEWNTILFLVGLFMLVGAMQERGAFVWLGRELVILTRGNLLATTLVILWGSALACSVVNAIPLTMATIPLIRSIVPLFAAQLGIAGDAAAVHVQVTYPLFWALSLGACLGGNGTLVGAAANVVIAQTGRRNGYDITFGRFARISFPLMLLSVVIAAAYLCLRYFLL